MRTARVGVHVEPQPGTVVDGGATGPRRRVLVVLLLLLLAFGVIGHGLFRSATRQGVRADGEVRLPSALADFRIDGVAGREVTPGRFAAIDLRLANPHPFPLTVSTILVRVSAVDAPSADGAHACDTTDFAVRQLTVTTALLVPAGQSVRLSDLGVPGASWPTLAMVDREVNQDGCKGASVRLTFTATGRRR